MDRSNHEEWDTIREMIARRVAAHRAQQAERERLRLERDTALPLTPVDRDFLRQMRIACD